MSHVAAVRCVWSCVSTRSLGTAGPPQTRSHGNAYFYLNTEPAGLGCTSRHPESSQRPAPRGPRHRAAGGAWHWAWAWHRARPSQESWSRAASGPSNSGSYLI